MKGWAKVGRCCAVGVPHPRVYENVCLCIVPATTAVPDLDEEEVRRFAEGKLDGLEISHVLILDNFPTVNGKIYRKTLRQMATDLFGNDQ